MSPREGIMKTLSSTVLFIAIACFSSQSIADQLNQRTNLKPRVRLKINKHLAKSYVPRKKHKQQINTQINRSGKNKKGSSGSTQNINTFNNVRNAPKEVITSVKGDIVNICFHCR
jgi:PBP1b-binding outer membrane lipoprotein LpoB